MRDTITRVAQALSQGEEGAVERALRSSFLVRACVLLCVTVCVRARVCVCVCVHACPSIVAGSHFVAACTLGAVPWRISQPAPLCRSCIAPCMDGITWVDWVSHPRRAGSHHFMASCKHYMHK